MSTPSPQALGSSTFSAMNKKNNENKLAHPAVQNEQPSNEQPEMRKRILKKRNTGTINHSTQRLTEGGPWLSSSILLSLRSNLKLSGRDFDPKLQKRCGSIEICAFIAFVVMLTVSVTLSRILFLREQLPVEIPTLTVTSSLFCSGILRDDCLIIAWKHHRE